MLTCNGKVAHDRRGRPQLIRCRRIPVRPAPVSSSPEQLALRVAHAIESADVRHMLGPAADLSPALLFDSLAFDCAPGLHEHMQKSFDVVAMPGENLNDSTRRGDVIIHRALGEGELAGAEMIVERFSGWPTESYVSVLPLDRGSRRVRKRRLTDRFGRLNHGTLILRPSRRHRRLSSRRRVRSPRHLRARFAPPPIGEAVVCTPASVPDSRRRGLHPTIRRGNTNSSVGHAQQLLNRFLAAAGTPTFCRDRSAATASMIASGLARLTSRGQTPLIVDCIFGRNTKLATQMFQACMNIARDGVIGPVTWAFLELLNPLVARPSITSRPCCILAPDFLTNVNILDPSAVGTHNGSSEANGQLYCGKAGFVDLGHVRDMIDLTKFLHDQLTASAGPPQVIRTILGIVSIRRTPTNPAETAAAIAFDDAMGHEIVSWDQLTPGGRNSSFSPEDLVSNFLGTVVARRAITAGGAFNAAATTELDSLLTSLDVQTKTESEASFGLINGRWVIFSGTTSLLRNDYLQRRNFTRQPFKTGHPSDAATPAFVTAAFSSTAKNDYDYFHLEGGNVLAKRHFAREIARIKGEARAAFGVDFDKP